MSFRHGGIRVLIPTGLGLNCEVETAEAFRRLGASADLVHLGDLFAGRHERAVSDYHVITFVGGFSYGDHVAGGLVLATRLRARLRDELSRFLDRGGLALGICNGFQVMIHLGLLPGPDDGRHDFVARADLAPNERLGYRDDWVTLRVEPGTHCLWTRGFDRIELPARHGEGRVLAETSERLEALCGSGRVPLRYVDEQGRPTEAWPWNPNGSSAGVASLTDASGRVLGLMPHPDAFLHPWHHPAWRREGPERVGGGITGLALFESGLEAAREVV
jgi:phosphoribosylformylglycinamidine synthase